MKIATWNVNGIGARRDGLVDWLGLSRPDVVCLHEIKTLDENFPASVFTDLGYAVETYGQKGFNGVAILSRFPLTEVERGLPGLDGDEQARFIAASVEAPGGPVRVACAYMPNGNPLGTAKFDYKLHWLSRLEAYAAAALATERALVLAGDFNIIPEARDAARPDAWRGDALFQPGPRQTYARLLDLGLSDAVRAVTDDPAFTFFDYQAGSWPKRNGIRIDHLLLSPEAADRLAAVGVEDHVRGWEKPSDHVPVWIRLDA